MATTKKDTKTMPPVFQKVMHHPRPALVAEESLKPRRPAAQSRDTREDRGARQAKTARNAQTLPHGR